MPCPNIFEKYELIHGACWRINNDMRGKNILDVIISNKSLYINTLISSYSQPEFICLRTVSYTHLTLPTICSV